MFPLGSPSLNYWRIFQQLELERSRQEVDQEIQKTSWGTGIEMRIAPFAHCSEPNSLQTQNPQPDLSPLSPIESTGSSPQLFPLDLSTNADLNLYQADENENLKNASAEVARRIQNCNPDVTLSIRSRSVNMRMRKRKSEIPPPDVTVTVRKRICPDIASSLQSKPPKVLVRADNNRNRIGLVSGPPRDKVVAKVVQIPVGGGSLATRFPYLKATSSGSYVLWGFLWALLLDEKYNNIVRWRNREESEFEIVNPVALTTEWALIKGRSDINWNKINKIIQLYVRRKILIRGEQNFVYTFCMGQNV